jgi:RND family efflux transporter MFP subunit
MKKKTGSFLAVILCFFATLPFPCGAIELEAISMPSADLELSFVMSGRVSDILVKEGDLVKCGDPLAGLDDRTEKIMIEELRASAEDRSRLKVASAELDQKRIDLKKLKSAHAKGAVTQWEIEHSKLNVRIAEQTLETVMLEQAQNRRRLDQALSQLDRMRIVTPVSGRIERVLVMPGESAKALEPIIQVVGIDPLWIDMPVPLDDVPSLSMGEAVSVVFSGSRAQHTAEGKVIHISSIADAASETLRVRLAVPNPNGRPAGERVLVRFSDEKQAAPGEAPLTIGTSEQGNG